MKIFPKIGDEKRLKIAIIERFENYENEKPFNRRYYLSGYFKDISDQLDILLIPIVSEKHIDEISKICDGLILTGSPNNIHPKYYNQEPIKDMNYNYDEYAVVKNAVECFKKLNKPILGICAGIQELNVIFGGTLNQLIPNHKLEETEYHKVNLDEDSFLYKVYGKTELKVNSYHRQSIKDIAPNFKITAISEDGVIEGIEDGTIIGAQWHPEILNDINFFEEFFKLAQKK